MYIFLMVRHFKALFLLHKLLAWNFVPFLEISLNTLINWTVLPSAEVPKRLYWRSFLFSCQSFTPDETAVTSKGFQFLTLAEAGKFPCEELIQSEIFSLKVFFTSFGKGDLLEQNRNIWSTSTDPAISGSQKAQQVLGRLIIKLLGAIIKTSS